MKDVFICRSKRTAIGRHGGILAKVRPDDEVVFGCANQAGEDNRNVARMAVLLSKLGDKVAAFTINRLCASGLDAVISGARSIACGSNHLVIAGGVESMSRAPFVIPKSESAFSRNAEIFDTTIGWRFANERIAATYGIDSMPETAENVAAEFNVSRADQDAFALRSQTLFDAMWHASDIAPLKVQGNKGAFTIISADEHPRGTTLEKLAALPTPFRTGGTVTAGNASGINDGACALLLASGDAVKSNGLTPLARIGLAASAGVAPRIMGTGPIAAVEKLTRSIGITARDFDVIEVNGLADDDPRINARGGGISLGHPLGMSGARIAATAARRIYESGAETALVTLCVGVGQGVALALHAA
jgi:acetyl-CoA acyltransferase